MPLARRRKPSNIDTNVKNTEKLRPLDDGIFYTESDVSEYDQTAENDDICDDLSTTLSGSDTRQPDTDAVDAPDQEMMLKPDDDCTPAAQTGDCTPAAQTAVRSSTRVSKPPRRETYSPPHSPVKKQCKVSVKENKCDTPKTKRTWELWSADDKTIFFEGLAEYGKDFDAIQNLISQKYKKKGVDPKMLKNKDQVRHFYYRTWHKISEYFAERDPVVKKRVQELYGLINYGELRKKIRGPLNDKGGKKLSDLIHTGVTTIKVRGKNIRIRTPVCKALKKINKIDDLKETTAPNECRVPDKIAVELSPRDNSSWAHIQSMAHNPRVRLALRPESKLSTIVEFFEKKWRPLDIRKRECLLARDLPITSGLRMFAYSECIVSPRECLLARDLPITSDLRMFAHSECIVSPVSVATVKQQPPPQLHFDNFLYNILGIKRKPSKSNDAETGGNSENSLSGYEGGTISSPELKINKPSKDPLTSPSETKIDGKTDDDSPVRDTLHATSKSLQCLNSLIVSDDNARFDVDFSVNSRENGLTSEDCENDPTKKDEDTDNMDVNETLTEHNAENVENENADPDQDEPMDVNENVTEGDERADDKIDDKTDDKNDDPTVNFDREAILQRFQIGWLKSDCDDLSLAELYVMFGRKGVLRLQYQMCDRTKGGSTDRGDNAETMGGNSETRGDNGEKGSNCGLSRTLSQLLVIASSQFADLVSKPKVPQEKSASLCSKCSATLPNKPTARKPNKPQDNTDSREAVFRVPTQPVKSVPFIQPGASIIANTLDMRLSQDASAGHTVRPRAIRKQILVQRRLLPKAQQHMAYPVAAQQGLVRFNNLSNIIRPSNRLTQILPGHTPQNIAPALMSQVSPILPTASSLVTSVLHTHITPSSLPTSTSTLSTESSQIFSHMTSNHSPILNATTHASTGPRVISASQVNALTMPHVSILPHVRAMSCVNPTSDATSHVNTTYITMPHTTMPHTTLSPVIVTSTPIPDRTATDLDTTISPTNLSALLDISLPVPAHLSDSTTDRFLDMFGNNTSFSGLLENDRSGLGVEQQWLNGEGADISLGTLLADSPSKRPRETETSALPPVNLFSDNSRDFLVKHDVDAHIQSIMNENSMDLTSKFVDIANEINKEPPLT